MLKYRKMCKCAKFTKLLRRVIFVKLDASKWVVEACEIDKSDILSGKPSHINR